MLSRSTLVKICRLTPKLVITAAVFYFLFSRLEWNHIKVLWYRMHLVWFGAGLLVFNFSQMASAWRLEAVAETVGVNMGFWGQVRLYYLGMFYNFFLPGGIGGDGYKVYYWFKTFAGSRRRYLFALLYDRLSGLVALMSLACILLVFSPLTQGIYHICSVVALFAVLGVWKILHKKVLHDFRPAAGRAFTRGLMIQGLQAGAVLCLARALSADASAGLALVFLVSSLAAAVPVTMGGMGARELVFFWAAPHVCLDSTVTVAIALLFFIITLISSMPGMYYNWLPQRL